MWMSMVDISMVGMQTWTMATESIEKEKEMKGYFSFPTRAVKEPQSPRKSVCSHNRIIYIYIWIFMYVFLHIWFQTYFQNYQCQFLSRIYLLSKGKYQKHACRDFHHFTFWDRTKNSARRCFAAWIPPRWSMTSKLIRWHLIGNPASGCFQGKILYTIIMNILSSSCCYCTFFSLGNLICVLLVPFFSAFDWCGRWHLLRRVFELMGQWDDLYWSC